LPLPADPDARVGARRHPASESAFGMSYFELPPAAPPVEDPLAPAALPPAAEPASPPREEHSRPVTVSRPFTQFAELPDALRPGAFEEGEAGVAGMAGDAGVAEVVTPSVREAGVAGVAGVAGIAGVALIDESVLAVVLDFLSFFRSLSVVAMLVLAPFVVLVDDAPLSDVVLDALPLGVVVLADVVVSVELVAAGFVVVPLTVPEALVEGAVAAGRSAFFSFWRSPMARTVVLPRAKTDIKNTGASLRIWVSFRFIRGGWVDEACDTSLQLPCHALGCSIAGRARRDGSFYEGA